MAYFGGASTERPWPKIDLRALATVLGLVLCTLLLGGILFSLRTADLGGFGLFGQKAEKNMAAAPKMMDILVAKRTILVGTKLNKKMFRVQSWPAMHIENKVVTNVETIKGAHSLSSIIEGTPLYKGYLSNASLVNRVTAKIPVGYRAVTIPVDELSGVEGWVEPGSHVDVVWSTNVREKLIVTIIVENAKIISAQRRTEETAVEDRSNVPRFVTLLLTLKDAQKIQLAKNSGSLSLSLRGEKDKQLYGSETMTLANLLNASDLVDLENVKGSVRIGSQEFALKGGKLRPLPPEEAKASFGGVPKQ